MQFYVFVESKSQGLAKNVSVQYSIRQAEAIQATLYVNSISNKKTVTSG